MTPKTRPFLSKVNSSCTPITTISPIPTAKFPIANTLLRPSNSHRITCPRSSAPRTAFGSRGMKRASRKPNSASYRYSLRRAALWSWASRRATCCRVPSRRSQPRTSPIALCRQSRSGRRKCCERHVARDWMSVAGGQEPLARQPNSACSRRLLRVKACPLIPCRLRLVRACRSFTSRADYRPCRSRCRERWPIASPPRRRKSALCSAWPNCVKKQCPGNTAPLAPRANRLRLSPRPRTLLHRGQCLSRGSRRRHNQLVPHRLHRRL